MPLLTKSQQVEKYIRSQISRGRWTAGKRLPPEQKLSARLGVSSGTVKSVVTRLAHAGLLDRTQRLGTFVAHTQATGYVAILSSAGLLASPAGYYFRRLAEEARKRIEAAGYRPILATGHGDNTASDEFMSTLNLLDRPVAEETLGVLSTVGLGPVEQRLAKEGICSVSIASDPHWASDHCVILDKRQLVAMAVELLRSSGYEDFAVMYTQVPRAGAYVTESLREQLRASGAELPPDRLVEVPYGDEFANTYDVFKQWWARPDRPKALFFYEDALCDVATRAILELGIKVPDDLAIVTHSNVGRVFHFPVPLTRVEFDPAEACTAAWNMLDVLINNRRGNGSRVYIPPRIRTGESLG